MKVSSGIGFRSRACRGTAPAPRRRRAGPAPPRRTPAPGSPARHSPESLGRSRRSISARRVSMAARRVRERLLGSGFALRRRFALGGDEQLVLRLPFAHQVLPLAHEPGKLRRALGRPRRHLRERGRGFRALRPLRRLEHLRCQAFAGAWRPRDGGSPCTRPRELPCSVSAPLLLDALLGRRRGRARRGA